jgi:hypothetical protein
VLTAFVSSPHLSDSWRDLYLMLGTSSAALIGLLFVATSLHLAEIANEEIYRLRAQFTTLPSQHAVGGHGRPGPATAADSRHRMSRHKPVGTVVSDHTALKGHQNPGRTRARRFFRSPRAVFYCRVPGRDRRRRGAHRRQRLGNVCGDTVLCEPADRLHMEWVDDHAGHRTGRAAAQMKERRGNFPAGPLTAR